jgi:hypothetical protein
MRERVHRILHCCNIRADSRLKDKEIWMLLAQHGFCCLKPLPYPLHAPVELSVLLFDAARRNAPVDCQHTSGDETRRVAGEKDRRARLKHAPMVRSIQQSISAQRPIRTTKPFVFRSPVDCATIDFLRALILRSIVAIGKSTESGQALPRGAVMKFWSGHPPETVIAEKSVPPMVLAQCEVTLEENEYSACSKCTG